jgi:hypothetical protein
MDGRIILAKVQFLFKNFLPGMCTVRKNAKNTVYILYLVHTRRHVIHRVVEPEPEP